MKVILVSQTYTVLFIESTLESVAHYPQKIYRVLKEKQDAIKVGVLHFDSIESRQKKRNNGKKTTLFGTDCFDVRSFGTFSLSSILNKLSPRVVVMFTHSFLIDRALIKACRKRGIMTVFFQHGVQTGELQRKKMTIKIMADKIRRYSRYGLYYLGVDPFAILRLSTWEFILRAAFVNLSQVPRVPVEETHCDYAFVWGEWYRDLFVRLNGYPRDRVHVIGYPDLDEVLKEQNYDGQIVVNSDKKHTLSMLYIGQPLVKEGVVSVAEYGRFMEQLVDLAKKLDIMLYVGVHPRDNYPYEVLHNEDTVKIVRESAGLIPRADVVIGHHSSLLGAALVCGKPVIIMDVFSKWSVPSVPGITDLATRRCKSMGELGDTITTTVRMRTDVQAQELSRKAQEYFAWTSGGVYSSFAEMLLRLL